MSMIPSPILAVFDCWRLRRSLSILLSSDGSVVELFIKQFQINLKLYFHFTTEINVAREIERRDKIMVSFRAKIRSRVFCNLFKTFVSLEQTTSVSGTV